MNQQQKSLRLGICAILFALAFRLCSPQVLGAALDALGRPDTVAFLIYAETGRDVRFSPSDPPPVTIYADLTFPPESVPAVPPPLPVFPDAGIVSVYYACPCRPDVQALLRQPLTWDLASGEPTVLILHTHTTESYVKGRQDYAETAAYRTADPAYNMLAVGTRVTELLEQAGIRTIHSTEFHDYPSYNGSYGRSRKTAAAYLKEYPSIRLVLDLHRDAAEGTHGQLQTHAAADGKDSAQLMVVVGTNAGQLAHKNWEKNLSLGLKLHAQLETQCPGITRPLCLRSQRFNQDLSPGALLIEVGAAGDTLEQALAAGEQLAAAITALSRGTGPIEAAKSSKADLLQGNGSGPQG